jgi:hypothetical protein
LLRKLLRMRLVSFTGSETREDALLIMRVGRMTGPHPEERPLGRVSKDGCKSECCVHPSRRIALRRSSG